MKTQRTPTAEESDWFDRLERLLKQVPVNIEVEVNHCGSITMHEVGTHGAYVLEHGDTRSMPCMGSFEAGDNFTGNESNA